jgi:hypothetical protein
LSGDALSRLFPLRNLDRASSRRRNLYAPGPQGRLEALRHHDDPQACRPRSAARCTCPIRPPPSRRGRGSSAGIATSLEPDAIMLSWSGGHSMAASRTFASYRRPGAKLEPGVLSGHRDVPAGAGAGRRAPALRSHRRGEAVGERRGAAAKALEVGGKKRGRTNPPDKRERKGGPPHGPGKYAGPCSLGVREETYRRLRRGTLNLKQSVRVL